MKKSLIVLFSLFAFISFAGVEAPFVQFAPEDYCNPHYFRTDQNWLDAQLITLNVHGGTNVWLSNYVQSFYEPIPDLNGNVYNMNAGKYGYIFKDDISNFNILKSDYSQYIQWSDGTTTEITYTYDADPSITNSTKGYLLDYFDEDAEIYLVMTTLPVDGNETVDSYQYVAGGPEDTTLQSRSHAYNDLAGNVRINYGINSTTLGYTAREFVAVYDSPVAGQPLPGVFASLVLGFGTIAGLKKIRKKS